MSESRKRCEFTDLCSDLQWTYSTVALLIGLLGGCYSSGAPDPRADTNTSWLQSCTQHSECAVGYACVQGKCMRQTGGQSGPPAQGVVTADASASGLAGASAPSSSHSPVTTAMPSPAPSTDGMQMGEELVLSEVARQAGPPVLRWIDDHWVAAWQSSPGPDGPGDGNWIEVVHVSPERVVSERRLQDTVNWSSDLSITEQGGLGVLHEYASCWLEVFHPDGAPVARPLTIPCGSDSVSAAVAVPDTPDWIIAWGEGEDGGPLMVGRFSLATFDWNVAPVSPGDREAYGALDVFTAGDDAVVVWGNEDGTSLARLPGLARASAPPAAPITLEPVVQMGGTVIGSDFRYGLAQTDAQTLVFGMDGEALWTAAQIAAEPQETRTWSLAPAGVADRRPGVAFAPEAGLVGICYATGPGPAGGAFGRQDGVAFVTVDEQGAAVGEPMVIADGLWNIGGCDVAWSGEAFLLAYWDIDLDDASPEFSLIRARIIEPR